MLKLSRPIDITKSTLVIEGMPLGKKEVYVDISFSGLETPTKIKSTLPLRYHTEVKGQLFDGKLAINVQEAIRDYENKYQVKVDLSKCNEIHITYRYYKGTTPTGIKITKIGLADAVEDVSTEPGKRGFRFKVISANGEWSFTDSLTGKTIIWTQWQPVAGENAWAGVIGPMQVYFQKYGNKRVPNATELKLAEEVARAAMLLQADNGGIRMAPQGTWSEAEPGTDPDKYEWMYYEISTENNLSWYAAFRMLYTITEKQSYKDAMEEVARYLKASFDTARGVFYQGMHYSNDKWVPNPIFATDCQTWAIDVLGPDTIDKWFGEGTAYRMWKKTKELAGIYGQDSKLLALDFTERKEVKSVEWTAGGILAAALLADHYEASHPDWAEECENDAVTMYSHMYTMKVETDGKIAWSYSDKRAPTGHGWIAAGRVLSTASTGWMALMTKALNPFILGKQEIPRLVKVVNIAVKNILEGKSTTPSPGKTGPRKSVPEQTPKKGEQPEVPSGNLWEKGSAGQYVDGQWRSKAIWKDYLTPIHMEGGQKLRIEYVLQGSDVMGVQLVPVGQSESARGDMIVLKGMGSKNVIEITVPTTREVRRIAFQFGEQAWGPLGGSLKATLLIKSIRFVAKGKSSSKLWLEQPPEIQIGSNDDSSGLIAGSIGVIGGIKTSMSNL